MLDHEEMFIPKAIDELTPELKKFLNETRSKLKNAERREFMANVVLLLGRGGQSRAERELGWDRRGANHERIRNDQKASISDKQYGLDGIALPTLILHALDDRLVDCDFAKYAHAHIPNSK